MFFCIRMDSKAFSTQLESRVSQKAEAHLATEGHFMVWWWKPCTLPPPESCWSRFSHVATAVSERGGKPWYSFELEEKAPVPISWQVRLCQQLTQCLFHSSVYTGNTLTFYPREMTQHFPNIHLATASHSESRILGDVQSRCCRSMEQTGPKNQKESLLTTIPPNTNHTHTHAHTHTHTHTHYTYI